MRTRVLPIQNNPVMLLLEAMPKPADFVKVAFGNLCVAVGIVAFIMPSGLISGGCTGIALLINHYSGLRVSEIVLVINVIMFLWGLAVIGKKFAAGTLISSLLYPVFLRILEMVVPSAGFSPFMSKMMCAVCGGSLVGFGVGMVLLAGASTGGTDPIPVTLHKYGKIPLGAAMMIVDSVIILLQVLISDPSSIIYGIVFVLLSSSVISILEKMSAKY